MTRLPGILAEIAEVAGEAAALQLASSHAGRRVNIPAHFRAGCWLAEAVGEKAARAIIDHFRTLDADDRPNGVRHVVIPVADAGTQSRARRQARIAFSRALDEGCGVRTAGLRAGLSESGAWKLRRRMKDRPDDGQGSLF